MDAAARKGLEPWRKIVTVRRDFAGQWQYQLENAAGSLMVDWQYAGWTRESALEQAQARFGYDVIDEERSDRQ